MPVLPCIVLCALLALAATGTDAKEPSTPPPQACIDIEVNGERVPAWDCLQQQLSPSSSARPPATSSEAERLMRRPGNQMLQYNLEGTRQRMGNTLGTSVQPQRPTR